MNVAVNAFVWALIAALPIGVGLAYWTDNPHWLWLSLVSFIFAMAGL